MSNFHCSCGFAADSPELFADHLGWVFDRDDDIGNDGKPHAEIIPGSTSAHLCACGFTATEAAEFNDHLLIMVMPMNAIGIDGKRHVPLDITAPDRWYVQWVVDG